VVNVVALNFAQLSVSTEASQQSLTTTIAVNIIDT
jgi:hypothetical protein